MPRHLELLNMGPSLRRYALRNEADVNASFLLVHKALLRAFSKSSDIRQGELLEASLRKHIDLRLDAEPVRPAP